MTAIQFLYMTGILWWILAGVVSTVVVNIKDEETVLLGNLIILFICVGGGHFAIAWLLNIDALPRLGEFFN